MLSVTSSFNLALLLNLPCRLVRVFVFFCVVVVIEMQVAMIPVRRMHMFVRMGDRRVNVLVLVH
ncbi:hypothetical protein [Thermodesulfitimonas autotrophica]|uniref:hypothetical protein n=1 Tax=Thermodesulfitimonas autotrophica TaxID=1894989 RepID=UPI000F4D6125|nr:hypothetical protein [Thermodesulfitimonas autotrophica]